MIRTQVQFTEEQAQRLRRVAAERGISMAALVRELVDEAIRDPRSACIARASAAVGRFGSGVTTVSSDHDAELEEAFRG